MLLNTLINPYQIIPTAQIVISIMRLLLYSSCFLSQISSVFICEKGCGLSSPHRMLSAIYCSQFTFNNQKCPPIFPKISIKRFLFFIKPLFICFCTAWHISPKHANKKNSNIELMAWR